MEKIIKFTEHFPSTRMRRNRKNSWSRRLTSETHLSVDDLIWPTFVIEGSGEKKRIKSMPGVYCYSIDVLVDEIRIAYELGIPLVAIFPHIDEKLKTPDAREAVNPDNLLCRAVREVKQKLPEVGVMCDVALDPFSSDGHDGLYQNGQILNDETLPILCAQALVQAEAGCDIIGPSDMMDGRVGQIRASLDENKFLDVSIMAYSAKYASGFYGPFRDAVGSSKNLKGDKKTYQMDPTNSDEAIREAGMDIAEGADMVMIKPGLPYLDIIKVIKQNFCIPTFAYNVSGEYAMLKAASEVGWLDYNTVMLETLTSFKRAGADGILTYHAREAALILKKS